MRFGPLVLFLLLLAPSSLAQAWDEFPKVPPGVVYKPLSASEMESVARRLRTILSSDYKGEDSLAGTLVICGPGLWPRWAGLELPSSVESIPGTFNPGGEGRFLRSSKPMLMLDNELRKTLAKDGGFKLRRPTSEELARFWAMIDFDIVEPLIMIESPRRVLLYYLTEDKVVWFDEYE